MDYHSQGQVCDNLFNVVGLMKHVPISISSPPRTVVSKVHFTRLVNRSQNNIPHTNVIFDFKFRTLRQKRIHYVFVAKTFNVFKNYNIKYSQNAFAKYTWNNCHICYFACLDYIIWKLFCLDFTNIYYFEVQITYLYFSHIQKLKMALMEKYRKE